MDKQVITVLVVGIIVTAAIAVYFANKGVPVKIGSPLFSAQIN